MCYPYHYYEAGEALPRCGDAVSYLAYDSGLEEISDSDKCGTCRYQASKAFPTVVSLDTPADPPR